jgi:hypothetical protein
MIVIPADRKPESRGVDVKVAGPRITDFRGDDLKSANLARAEYRSPQHLNESMTQLRRFGRRVADGYYLQLLSRLEKQLAQPVDSPWERFWLLNWLVQLDKAYVEYLEQLGDEARELFQRRLMDHQQQMETLKADQQKALGLFQMPSPDRPGTPPPEVISQKPIGSRIQPEEMRESFGLIAPVPMVPEGAALRVLSPNAKIALADGLRLGSQAFRSEFNEAYPLFAQEVEFVQRLLIGESIQDVLRDAQEIYTRAYGYAKSAPPINKMFVYKIENLQNFPDTTSGLPYGAVAGADKSVLHVVITPGNAIGAFHEIYEHLILPLDPTILTEQREANSLHTLAAVAEGGFGDNIRSDRQRRQLGLMTLEPTGRLLSLRELLNGFGETKDRILKYKFPAAGHPFQALTAARQRYVMTHAMETRRRVLEMIDLLYDHYKVKDDGLIDYSAAVFRAEPLSSDPAAIESDRTMLDDVVNRLAQELEEASIDAVSFSGFLSANPEISLQGIAQDHPFVPIQQLVFRVFDEILGERQPASMTRPDFVDLALRNVAKKSYRIDFGPRPTSPPLTLEEVLTDLAHQQVDAEIPVWDSKKSESGEWELIPVWMIRNAIENKPPQIEALKGPGGIEYRWIYDQSAAPETPHEEREAA